VSQLTLTAARRVAARSPIPLHAFAVLAKAGFRRYSTYRQATIAGIFTNSVFGFLRCFVILATAAGAAETGHSAGGYRTSQLVAFVWIGQGMIATVNLAADTVLSTRIRTGEVVSDLLRPVHPVTAYFAADLGRAGYALLTRFVVPIAIGLLAFDFYIPQRPVTYPLFAISMVAAVSLCFACKYVVNAWSYWLLDGRGPQLAWTLCATVLGGLYFPLRFLPTPVLATLWLATPFPSLLQAPLDIAVERTSTAAATGYIGVQLVWVALAFWAAIAVQRHGERRLVINGG
jgi:ABC-2 type transport system permease protein